MRCTSKSNINVRQTKKRAIAMSFLICFIVISLLSEAFILTHADHVHDHNGAGGACTTCAQIQNTDNILRQLGTAVISGFIVLAGLYAVAAIGKGVCSNIAVLTPVASKIRMNN